MALARVNAKIAHPAYRRSIDACAPARKHARIMRLLPAILATWMILLTFPVTAADRLTVFAAASLGEVMTRIGEAYARQHGTALRFSFAASSTLARQVEAGAPADIIVSANADWMQYLQARSAIVSDSRIILARNALALVGHRDRFPAPLPLARAIADLAAGERMAIGDPAHVPAGIYARQALTGLHLWADMRPRMVYAADVRAALALVARGEAALALTYVTDARIAADDVTLMEVLPDHLHDAITYPAAIVAGRDSLESRRFMAFLDSADVAAILRGAGFRKDVQP